MLAVVTALRSVPYFSSLNSQRGFDIVATSGTNTLEAHYRDASQCSARELNTIRGQGSLYLRLKPVSILAL